MPFVSPKKKKKKQKKKVKKKKKKQKKKEKKKKKKEEEKRRRRKHIHQKLQLLMTCSKFYFNLICCMAHCLIHYKCSIVLASPSRTPSLKQRQDAPILAQSVKPWPVWFQYPTIGTMQNILHVWCLRSRLKDFNFNILVTQINKQLNKPKPLTWET